MLRVPRHLVVRRSLSALVAQTDADRLNLHLRRVLGLEMADECELRLMHPEGAALRVKLSSRSLSNAGPIVTTIFDLGNTETDERDLAKLVDRLRLFIERTDDVYFIARSSDGRVLYLSPAFETMFGQRSMQFDGGSAEILDLVHPNDRSKAVRTLAVFLRGDPLDVELRVGTDRDSRIARVRAFADPSNDQIVGVITDITDSRALEEQLRHAHKMEAIGALASGIAHDFNNVLMGVIGFATIALKGGEHSREAVRRVIEIAKRGATLPRKYEVALGRHRASLGEMSDGMFERAVRGNSILAEIGPARFRTNDIEVDPELRRALSPVREKDISPNVALLVARGAGRNVGRLRSFEAETFEMLDDLRSALAERRQRVRIETTDLEAAVHVRAFDFKAELSKSARELRSIDRAAGLLRAVDLGVGERLPASVLTLGRIEDHRVGMKLGIHCATRVVVEAGDQEVVRRVDLDATVPLDAHAGGVSLQVLQRRGDRFLVSPQDSPISVDQREQADALRRAEHQVVAGTVRSASAFLEHDSVREPAGEYLGEQIAVDFTAEAEAPRTFSPP
jgi:PAS domain S-box-containing protein